jgi:hypothetical protein
MTAIETSYNGVRFRSRTEARWAVFFDASDIPWEYEREGFRLKTGQWYLPDFWLPTWNCFVEIKGEEPPEEAIEKCRALRDESDKPVLLIVGTPGYQSVKTPEGYDVNAYKVTLFCWDLSDSSGGTSEWECDFVITPDLSTVVRPSNNFSAWQKELLDGRWETLCFVECRHGDAPTTYAFDRVRSTRFYERAK